MSYVNEGSDDEVSFGQQLAAATQPRALAGTKRTRHSAADMSDSSADSEVAAAPAAKCTRALPADIASGGSGEEDTTHKKRNKHAPTEMSTTRPVARFRQVIAVSKKEIRDPRFEATAGSFNEDFFRQNFSFLGEYKDKEIAALKAELKTSKAPSDRAELQTLLTKLQQQRAEELRRDAVRSVVRQQKKSEVEKISEGKKPYFLKKSALRDIAAATRFTELESKGDTALEKAFKKRRKKLASKDRKWLPPSSTTRG